MSSELAFCGVERGMTSGCSRERIVTWDMSGRLLGSGAEQVLSAVTLSEFPVLQPHVPESTGSRLISKVKLVTAQSVLWWVTTWEY